MAIIRPLLLCLLLISSFTLTINSAFATENKEVLRVLTWAGGETYLPREGHPQDLEIQYLQQFSELHDLLNYPSNA